MMPDNKDYVCICRDCKDEFYGNKYEVKAHKCPCKDLVYRLRKRAEIRRTIPTRKSVQEGKPDRIADLFEEAADRIQELENK